MNFHNFFSIHVFEVKEFIADIPSELPYSDDIENPDQLPGQEVLMILSYKFLKFLHCKLRNPLLIFLLSYRNRVTSKIWVNFRGTRGV